jgi:hypothetical protein
VRNRSIKTGVWPGSAGKRLFFCKQSGMKQYLNIFDKKETIRAGK